MTYRPSIAEAQAMGLCSLARQRSKGGNAGLPDIHNLRVAVAQLHPADGCGWCDHPLEELDRILRAFNATRTQLEDDRWMALPASAKRAAIQQAQGVAA